MRDRILRLWRQGRSEGGYTLIELIVVMAILLTILTALTSLFVSGARAELDANERFQAQQEARIALDRMRREIHCASGIAAGTGAPVDTIVVTLPAGCPGTAGADATVTYSAVYVDANRYKLNRTKGLETIKVADYLTTASPFTWVAPSDASLGKLSVDFTVNVHPSEGWKKWRLVDNIVLRNTTRSS